MAVEVYHNENKTIIMTHHTSISAKQFLELERARKNEEQAKNEETARVILDSFYSELSRINPWKGLTSNWYNLDGTAGPEVHAIVKKELEAEGYQVSLKDHAIRVHNPEKPLVLSRDGSLEYAWRNETKLYK